MSAFGLSERMESGSFLNLPFPSQPMAVIKGYSEVNGDVSMRVLKVAPVDTIKVSWEESEGGRHWHKLIRSACYVLHGNAVTCTHHTHRALVSQPLLEQTCQAPTRQQVNVEQHLTAQYNSYCRCLAALWCRKVSGLPARKSFLLRGS